MQRDQFGTSSNTPEPLPVKPDYLYWLRDVLAQRSAIDPRQKRYDTVFPGQLTRAI